MTASRVSAQADASARADGSRREQVYARRWRILAVIVACEFVAELDTSIVNIALPTLGRQLDATASELQWTVDAYTLVFASLLLFCGALVDRLGGRRLLFAGGLIFAAGSAWAALAPATSQLIAARVVMGVGAAMIFPATVFILADVFPPYERAKAFAVWSSVAGLSFALGPPLGAWLVDEGGWSAIFWVNLPILGVALAAAASLVPRIRSARRTVDALGAVLAVGGLTALIYGVIDAPKRGWSDPRVLATIGLGVLLLVGFARSQMRSGATLVRRDLLRGTRAAHATAVLVLIFLPVTGSLFIDTLYLQYYLGHSALGAGIRILPVAIVFAVGASASMAVAQRLGTRSAVTLGLGLLTVALGTMVAISDSTGYPLLLVSLLIGGLGMGLAVTPTMAVTLNGVPLSDAGVGSSLNMTGLMLGGALGVAIMGSVLSAAFASGVDVTSGLARSTGAALAAARDDFIDGARLAFLVGSVVAAAGVILARVTLPPEPAEQPLESAAAEAEPAGVPEPA